MSRYYVDNVSSVFLPDFGVELPEKVDVAYGFDHALGYFVQIFGDKEEPIVDVDSLFGGINNSKMLELVKALNANAHAKAVALDLKF